MSPHPKLAQFAGPALRVQPDRRLARLAAEGNDAAFEEIVRRYRPRLVSFAAAIVPAHRAEDIVQESLARVYTALAESDGSVHLGPWLYTIVRNRALNAVRDERVHVELDEQHDYVPPPPEVVARRAELAALVAGMRELPEAQREALVQRELEGRTHDQIAARLGTSPASVRGLIFRARTALRQATGALLPLPLLRWLTADEARAGVAETAAGGIAAAGAAAAGASGTGVAAKAGAVVVAAALATSAGLGLRGPDRSPAPPGSSPERAEAFARDGNDEGQPGRAGRGPDLAPQPRMDNSGPGSLSSGPGSSGSDSSGSGSSGSSGSGSSGSDSSDSGSSGSGSGSSESGSSGSGSSGSGSGSSRSDSSGSGSSGSDSSDSGSSGSGSGSSGSDSSGSGSSGSGDELDDD